MNSRTFHSISARHTARMIPGEAHGHAYSSHPGLLRRAANGHAAAPPSSEMNSRRFVRKRKQIIGNAHAKGPCSRKIDYEFEPKPAGWRRLACFRAKDSTAGLRQGLLRCGISIRPMSAAGPITSDRPAPQHSPDIRFGPKATVRPSAVPVEITSNRRPETACGKSFSRT